MAKKASKKSARKKRKSAPDGKRLLKKIRPVGETEENQIILVYGRAGTGKTNFGSTLPRPNLFLDINERGLDTIRDQSGIDVLQIETWDDIDDIFWELRGGMDYKSITLDQATNLQNLGMAEIRQRAKKSDSELFTKKNWGELSGLMRTTLDNYRGLVDQYNICFIAHERIFDDRGDDEDQSIDPVVGARMMPSVADFLEGAVTTIGSTFIREDFVKKGSKKERQVDYCMRIGPHAVYTTKVRRPPGAGPLPEFITDPSFKKILDLNAGKSIAKKKVTKKRKKVRRK